VEVLMDRFWNVENIAKKVINRKEITTL
jgi:hypothetical protein